jgi:hypothetical protein
LGNGYGIRILGSGKIWTGGVGCGQVEGASHHVRGRTRKKPERQEDRVHLRRGRKHLETRPGSTTATRATRSRWNSRRTRTMSTPCGTRARPKGATRRTRPGETKGGSACLAGSLSSTNSASRPWPGCSITATWSMWTAAATGSGRWSKEPGRVRERRCDRNRKDNASCAGVQKVGIP